MEYPSATAMRASAQMRVRAASSPAGPSDLSNVMSTTIVFQPRYSIFFTASISSRPRSGPLSERRLHCCSTVSVKSPSGPIMHRVDVTTASRMGSIGGLVTCPSEVQQAMALLELASRVILKKQNPNYEHRPNTQFQWIARTYWPLDVAVQLRRRILTFTMRIDVPVRTSA